MPTPFERAMMDEAWNYVRLADLIRKHGTDEMQRALKIQRRIVDVRDTRRRAMLKAAIADSAVVKENNEATRSVQKAWHASVWTCNAELRALNAEYDAIVGGGE